MYKNKNKNTRDKATQPAQATNAVSSPPCTNYEELDELQLERCIAGNGNSFLTSDFYTSDMLSDLPRMISDTSTSLTTVPSTLPPNQVTTSNGEGLVLNNNVPSYVVNLYTISYIYPYSWTYNFTNSYNTAPEDGMKWEVNSFMRPLQTP